MASKINKNKVIAAAQKYVQRGQYDRAIREYRKVVEEDPRDVRIWLKIGDLHAKKNATQDAVDTYLKVAEFYSEQGFYLKAVAVYKQILKLNPALVDVNLKLAELYKQLGLLNDAMQQYELVSNHYHQQGRTKDALAAVRQIVDLDPENVASRIKLAELYSKEQMREEAVEEFAKAADFLRASNRIEDFIKVAERLVYHQPDNLPVSKELASLYLRRRDPRRALQKLQLAFKADPRDEHTLGMLAQAFEDLGQVAKTISVLKELAHIHAENGDDTKRRATLERILALAPDDAEARRLLDAVPAGDGAAAAAAPAAGAMPPAEAIQPAAPAASPSPSPAPAPPRAPGAV
ncbi:MAG: tetratricopeptide repeat protein, partial [Myxococcales bacterium]|nr:tetratricopeptide repeat protein [Myxococcales bacterium]